MSAPMAKDAASEISEFSWMVRPCEMYKEEYRDCKSFGAKFHQYYVHGKLLDCSEWKKDYGNCVKWRKARDQAAMVSVIQSEKSRVATRRANSRANDTWELRAEPPDPKDWNSPLPDWMLKEHENSYLQSKKLNQDTAHVATSTNLCTIL